jgi:hypothetical protein
VGSSLACNHDLAANTNHRPRTWKCRVWLLAHGHCRRKTRRIRYRLLPRQSLKHLLLAHPCDVNLVLAAGGELHPKLQHINHRICRSGSRDLRVTNRGSNPSPPDTAKCLHRDCLHLLLGAALLAQAQLPLKVGRGLPLISGAASHPRQQLQVTQRLKSQVLVNL